MRALAVRSEALPMRDSSRRRELIRVWLAKFAVNSNRKMDSDSARATLALWVEAFADVPLQADAMLEAAFRETLLRCQFFPSVAEIRSHFPAARTEIYGATVDHRQELTAGTRRGHRCPELVPFSQIADAFRGVVRELPPPEIKEKPANPVGFRFPNDPGHESRVRKQAQEMLAKAEATA